MASSGKAIDPGSDFLIIQHKPASLMLGEGKRIFCSLEDGKEAMQDTRSHVFRHPPPYLGITCSRYGASLLSAEDISGYSVTGGTTDEKTQPVNVMEVFYSLIRKQAWTAFHPPPPI